MMRIRSVVVALALLFAGSTALAGTVLDWDPNQQMPFGGAGGGTGAWTASGSGLSWYDLTSNSNVPWVNLDTAKFGGFAGTVSVDTTAGAVIAGEIDFNLAGYELKAFAAGDVLGLQGPINANASATISVPLTLGSVSTWTTAAGASLLVTGTVDNGGNKLTLAGAGNTAISGSLGGLGGLDKNGSGTLYLSGVNTFGNASNGITVNGGTLSVYNTLNLGDAATKIVLNAARLQVTNGRVASNLYPGWNRSIQVGGNSVIDTSSADTRLTRTMILTGGLSGSGTLTKTGRQTMRLLGDATVNTFSGDLVLAPDGGALMVAGTAGALPNVASVTVYPGSTFEVNSNSPAGLQNNRLNDAAPITLYGATLRYQGGTDLASQETFGNLTLAAGNNWLEVLRNGGGTAYATFANFNRNLGTTLILGQGGQALGGGTPSEGRILFAGTTPALVGGALGTPSAAIMPGVRQGNNSLATYDLYGMRVLAATEYAYRDIDDNGATNNANVKTPASAQTVDSNQAINSLVWGELGSENFGITINSGVTLTVQSGTILAYGSDTGRTFAGPGTITAGTLAGSATTAQLTFFQQRNQTITFTAQIADNAAGAGTKVAFVKDGGGPGTVTFSSLAADNTYSGGTFVNTGTLTTGSTAGRRYLGSGKVEVNGFGILNLASRGATSYAGSISDPTYSVRYGGQINWTSSVARDSNEFVYVGAGSFFGGVSASGTGLNSFTRGTNIVLEPDSIVGHRSFDNSALNGTGSYTIQNLGTNADLYWGISNVDANAGSAQGITIGVGTPWKGMTVEPSSDRRWSQGTITAAAGTTDIYFMGISGGGRPNDGGYARQFYIGNTTTAGNATITASSPVTAHIVGNGTVTLDDNTNVFNNISFVVEPGARLKLNQPTALGSGSTPVVAYAGGTVEVSSPLAVNSPVTILPDARLLASSGSGIAGVGALSLAPGAILEVTNTAAIGGAGTQLTTALSAGSIVRLSVSSPLNLGLLNQAAVYQVYNADRTLAAGLNDGINLNGGTLTNDTTSRALSGGVIAVTGSGGATFAASTGTTLTINNAVTGGAYPVTVGGPAVVIDGANKSLNSTVRFNGPVTLGGDLSVRGENSLLYLDENETQLSAGTLAANVIVGNAARVQIRANNPPATARYEFNQKFTFEGSPPGTSFSLQVNRDGSTSNAVPVNFNNIVLQDGAVFAPDEDNADVRVTLKLAGNALMSRQFDQVDFLNLESADGAMHTLTHGRLGDTHSTHVIYGQFKENVTLDIINADIKFEVGSNMLPGAVINNLGIAHPLPLPGGGMDPSAVTGYVEVRAGQDNTSSPLSGGTINLAGGQRAKIYSSDTAVGDPQWVNTLGTVFNIKGGPTTSTYNSMASTGYIYTERDTTNFPDTVNNGRVLLNNVRLEAGAVLQAREVNGIQLQLGGTTAGTGLVLGGSASIGATAGVPALGNITTETAAPQTLSIVGPNTTTLSMLGTIPANLTVDMTGNILRLMADPTAGMSGSDTAVFNLNTATSGRLELRHNLDGTQAPAGWGSRMIVNMANGTTIRGYTIETAAGVVPPHGGRIVNLFNGVVNVAAGGTGAVDAYFDSDRSVDVSWGGYFRYTDVRLANGALIQIQKQDDERTVLDLTLQGAAAKVIQADTQQNLYLGDMKTTNPGGATFTIVPKSAQVLRMVGAVGSGLNLVQDGPGTLVMDRSFDMEAVLGTSQAFYLNGATLDLLAGVLSIGSNRTPPGATANVLYNIGPQPGTINHTTGGGDLRIVTGGDGTPGSGLDAQTTINLGNNRVVMGYVDEVDFGTRVVNDITAKIVLAPGAAGTLRNERLNDRALDGYVRFRNVQMGAESSVRIQQGNSSIIVDPTLSGNARIWSQDNGVVQFVGNVAGSGPLPSVLEIGGTQNLKLVGTLTNAEINATNTGGTNLTSVADLTGLGGAPYTTFALNGRTVTFNAGAGNVVNVNPGAGRLIVNGGATLTSSLADMPNTSVTVNAGGTFAIDSYRTVGSFIHNGGTFNHNFNMLQVNGRLGGNGTIDDSAWAQLILPAGSGMAPGPDAKTTGTLTVGSGFAYVPLPDAFTYDWKFNATGSDKIRVDGAFDYSSATVVNPVLSVRGLDGSAPAASYTILEWTGGDPVSYAATWTVSTAVTPYDCPVVRWTDGTGNWDTMANWSQTRYSGGTVSDNGTANGFTFGGSLTLTGLSASTIAPSSIGAGMGVTIAPAAGTVTVTGPAAATTIDSLTLGDGTTGVTRTLNLSANLTTATSVTVKSDGALNVGAQLNAPSFASAGAVAFNAGAAAALTSASVTGGTLELKSGSTAVISAADLAGGTTTVRSGAAAALTAANVAAPAQLDIEGLATVYSSLTTAGTTNVKSGGALSAPLMNVTGGAATFHAGAGGSIPTVNATGGMLTLQSGANTVITNLNVDGTAVANVNNASVATARVTAAGAQLNLNGTVGTLSLGSGQVFSGPGAKLTSAGLAPASAFNTQGNRLTVENAVAFGDFRAALSGAPSFQLQGSNLADSSVDRTFVVSGGSLYLGSGVAGFGGNGAGWTLNGGPTVANDVLTITTAAGSLARSAFADQKIGVTSDFSVSFQYRDVTTAGADGGAFVLQSVGPTALGGSGGSKGYAGIAPSAAIVWNIYNNTQVDYLTNGNATPTTVTGNGIDLRTGVPVDFVINYNAALQQLSYTLTQGANVWTPAPQTGVDLAALLGSSEAWFGFTGGTGGTVAEQQISNFVLTYGAAGSLLDLPHSHFTATADSELKLGYPAANLGKLTLDGGALTLAGAGSVTFTQGLTATAAGGGAGGAANVVVQGQTALAAGSTVKKIGAGTLSVQGNSLNWGANAVAEVVGGTLQFNLPAGAAVAVGSGAMVKVDGTATELVLAGPVSALADAVNRADVLNDKVLRIADGATQTVGDIGGTGSTIVGAGSSLTADSIVQDTLTIGAGGAVTIRETTAGGAVGANAVPEPGTWLLLLAGGLCLAGWLRRRRA